VPVRWPRIAFFYLGKNRFRMPSIHSHMKQNNLEKH
jgi:hypothetical protein